MKQLRVQLRPAITVVLLATVILGIAYPLTVTLASQALFGSKANGTLVFKGGKEVGSRILGQQFSDSKYFKGRPFFGERSYDDVSGSSNLASASVRLREEVTTLVKLYRTENGLAADVSVPVDAVTESASGRDPHISVANALLQAPRVAKERGLTIATVKKLIDEHTDGRSVGFLGDKGVNVVSLNTALDVMGE